MRHNNVNSIIPSSVNNCEGIELALAVSRDLYWSILNAYLWIMNPVCVSPIWVSLAWISTECHGWCRASSTNFILVHAVEVSWQPSTTILEISQPREIHGFPEVGSFVIVHEHMIHHNDGKHCNYHKNIQKIVKKAQSARFASRQTTTVYVDRRFDQRSSKRAIANHRWLLDRLFPGAISEMDPLTWPNWQTMHLKSSNFGASPTLLISETF